MNISYDEIRRIYRLEKNTNRLVEVEDDFFDSLNTFMVDEKQAYLEGLKNLSANKARDFSNLKKMVEEIMLVREKKLLNKALIASRTGELSVEKIALQEKKTVEELVKVLEDHRSYLDAVFESPEKSAGKSNAQIAINTRQAIPKFVGADLKEYGPFEKDKNVKLPFRVANLLISRELAQEA
jgi:DNA replication initiation complex subunit (GINS family)